MCMGILLAYMGTVPVKARTQVYCNRQVGTAMWVLGVKPRSSGTLQQPSPFNH